jgi:hypothetical protein
MCWQSLIAYRTVNLKFSSRVGKLSSMNALPSMSSDSSRSARAQQSVVFLRYLDTSSLLQSAGFVRPRMAAVL